MTRKPQTAWGLQIDWGGRREPYIMPRTIRDRREQAEAAFWGEWANKFDDEIEDTRDHFRTGVYKFVKVNITPVEDNQK